MNLFYLVAALGLALPAGAADKQPAVDRSIADQCFTALKALPGKANDEALRASCAKAEVLDSCQSEKGIPIFHVDVPAKPASAPPKKILVFALIHGDEYPSGSVARSWMERLTRVEPRNQWRIVPVLNPDGVKAHTRYNSNGVDLNRNFPTKNWEKDALPYWEKQMHKDKRRFPGKAANSEKETHCAIAHIDSFKPDLILSIHVPYQVLDFDGPEITPPNFPHIPWKSLGTYPGSLGRYMWVDQSKPILTVELAPKGAADKLEEYDRLQDITGDIAIKSEKLLRDKNGAMTKMKGDEE